jgi:RimJ/RimL family protein N-acetyltransferase
VSKNYPVSVEGMSMLHPHGRILSISELPIDLAYPKESEPHRIVLNDPEDGEAIALAAGCYYNPFVDRVICHHKGNTRLGGIIYSGFTGESIAAHSASWDPHWINRDMIFMCFDYPFNQLGVKRMFGQVPEDNQQALEFNKKMGFKPVARIEGVYRHNIACIVMCLEREDCRLLGVKPRSIKSNRA